MFAEFEGGGGSAPSKYAPKELCEKRKVFFSEHSVL